VVVRTKTRPAVVLCCLRDRSLEEGIDRCTVVRAEGDVCRAPLGARADPEVGIPSPVPKPAAPSNSIFLVTRADYAVHRLEVERASDRIRRPARPTASTATPAITDETGSATTSAVHPTSPMTFSARGQRRRSAGWV
jgi:hypothetical protein